jgi:hypothetical protein
VGKNTSCAVRTILVQIITVVSVGSLQLAGNVNKSVAASRSKKQAGCNIIIFYFMNIVRTPDPSITVPLHLIELVVSGHD